jgi:hypothetical protein
MTKKKLKAKADLWLALRGLKVFPHLSCEEICVYYNRISIICPLRKRFTFNFNEQTSCIKWLDNDNDKQHEKNSQ